MRISVWKEPVCAPDIRRSLLLTYLRAGGGQFAAVRVHDGESIGNQFCGNHRETELKPGHRKHCGNTERCRSDAELTRRSEC